MSERDPFCSGPCPGLPQPAILCFERLILVKPGAWTSLGGKPTELFPWAAMVRDLQGWLGGGGEMNHGLAFSTLAT